MSPPLTRFAPSPTGYLHLGHARAALEAFQLNMHTSCLLRIEDIDHTRCRAHFTDAIYEDLAWLGFKWPEPVRVQSEHVQDYVNVVQYLQNLGLVYPCQKSRAEIKADSKRRDPLGHPLYDGPAPKDAFKVWKRGKPTAWRLSLSACRDYLGTSIDALKYIETGVTNPLGQGQITIDITHFGDGTLLRKDIGSSYHVAVTHDDALQNITHVVRGADLAPVTGIHCLLQKLLDWPTPIYHHHALLLRPDGEKLAKRNMDTSIRSLRERGLSPQDVLDMALAASAG